MGRRLKEVKMPREKAIALYQLMQWFEEWEKIDPPRSPLKPKFVNALAINQETLESTVKAFTKTQKMDVSYIAYDKARVELAKELAQKDAEGQPMLEGNAYILGDNQSEFNSKLAILRTSDDHKEACETREEYLKEEITLSLYTVDIDFIPDVGLPMWKLMKDFIVDPENEE